MKITNLTNLEISKKLKEIGFETKTLFYWTKVVKFKKTDPDIDCITIISENEKWRLYKTDVPAYDLETLLDALPKYVARNSDRCGEKNSLQVCVASKQIYYEDDLGIYKGYRDLKQLFFTTTIDNESLADTAGRLLIKLFEAGIIKFKK